MKKKTFLIIIIIFIIFCFVVLFKGLNKSNIYVPSTSFKKQLLSFSTIGLFNNKQIYIDEIFVEDKIYLLNIWSSWCTPCRAEHSILMELSKNPSIKIIGLNYKDDLINAKEFINKLGNPYSEILIDQNGTISIAIGAYGVPETLIINNNKIILKKFIGPLNADSVNEIKSLLK